MPAFAGPADRTHRSLNRSPPPAPSQEERNFGRAVGDRSLRRAPPLRADAHRITRSNDDEPGQLALDQRFFQSLADDGK